MCNKLIVSKDINAIMLSLKKYGIAIVPSYLSSEELEGLQREFIEISGSDISGGGVKHKHPTNEDGMVIRVKRENLKDSDFPVTKGVFGSSFMNDILTSYYSPFEFKLNDDIFLTHEKPCEVPILPWHFDRVQSLKFFIYLKDVTKNDGAFEYSPGTHNEGHYRANYALATGTSLEKLPNDIPESEIINPVTIEGEAGDLIIFDSDGFHRGGIVGPDGERMVMRGHSHPIGGAFRYGKAKPFSKMWFVGSCFNLAKLFKDDYSRVLGTDIKTKAKTR
ncbi:MAG: phytanoyl-CoA dioxygenase family protein [Marinomonas colpomeniae]